MDVANTILWQFVTNLHFSKLVTNSDSYVFAGIIYIITSLSHSYIVFSFDQVGFCILQICKTVIKANKSQTIDHTNRTCENGTGCWFSERVEPQTRSNLRI